MDLAQDVGHGFRVGDQVVLVKPFRCDGDSRESDRDYDERLRRDQDVVLGVVSQPAAYGNEKYINVAFMLANGHTYDLFTNPDCIQLVGASEEEEAEAIASITKTIEALGG